MCWASCEWSSSTKAIAALLSSWALLLDWAMMAKEKE
jgi:hypothetical protein